MFFSSCLTECVCCSGVTLMCIVRSCNTRETRHTAQLNKWVQPWGKKTWESPLNPWDGSLNKVRHFAHLLCSCSHSVYYVKQLSWSQASKSTNGPLTFYSELCTTKNADCSSADSREDHFVQETPFKKMSEVPSVCALKQTQYARQKAAGSQSKLEQISQREIYVWLWWRVFTKPKQKGHGWYVILKG